MPLTTITARSPDHYWPMDDAGSPLVDWIGTADLVYSAGTVSYQRPILAAVGVDVGGDATFTATLPLPDTTFTCFFLFQRDQVETLEALLQVSTVPYEDGVIFVAYGEPGYHTVDMIVAETVASYVSVYADVIDPAVAHSVMGTVDGATNTVTIYLDGVLALSGTSPPMTPSTNLTVGSVVGAGWLTATPFDGCIAELAWWNGVVLDGADAAAMHAEALIPVGPPPMTVTAVTAVAVVPTPTISDVDPIDVFPAGFDGADAIPGPAVVELIVVGVNDTLDVWPESADFASAPPGVLDIGVVAVVEPPPEPPVPPAPSPVPLDEPDPWHVPDPIWP